MRKFNLIIDSVTLYFFLYFVAPIFIKNYESLGVTLPVVTQLFLVIGDFWRFFYYCPIAIYLTLTLIITNYIPFFNENKYCIILRMPFLISLVGSIVFLSIPIEQL